MELVNIPSTNEDPQCRYKMPRLISKFEGRGNAIKTCIVNMGDVARALRQPPQYATKWFGSELGADSQYVKKEDDAEYCYIKGSHDVSAFQSLLDDFIDKYVCCVQCHLPEVDMYILRGRVHGKCKACGWSNALDNKHRVAHFIAKHPPDESGFNLKGCNQGCTGSKLVKKTPLEVDSDFSDLEFDEEEVVDYSDSGQSTTDGNDEHKEKKDKKAKKEKKGKKEKKDKKHKKDKKEKKEKKQEQEDLLNSSWSTDDDEINTVLGDDTEDDSSADDRPNVEIINTCFEKDLDKSIDINETMVVQEKVSATQHYSCRYTNAIKSLRQYVNNEGESLTAEGFFDELRVAQLAEAFDNKMRLYVVLEALLGDNMDVHSVLAHKAHIQQAIDNASMSGADALWGFNAYLQAHPSRAEGFPSVLKTICDEDWACEKEVLEYYKTDEYIAEPGFELAQKHANSFLRWLSTAASDDEDEHNA